MAHGSVSYENSSPIQYLDMILKAWGHWDLFQELLAVLRLIGDRHGGLSIANIATRWVLDHPVVGAVIIGKYPLALQATFSPQSLQTLRYTFRGFRAF